MTDETRVQPIPEAPRAHVWRGILLRTLAVLLVVGGVYVGLAYYFGDRIAAGTTVEGVAVGSLSEQRAQDVLADKLDDVTSAEIVVSTAGTTVRIDPAQAGLRPDYDATLSGLTGLTFDPRNLVARVTGEGRDLELQVTREEEALLAAVEGVAPQVAVEPVEAEVVLTQGEVRTALPAPGRALDVQRTAEAILAVWPQDTQVDAAMVPVPSQLSVEQVETFVQDVARPALSGPLVVAVQTPQTGRAATPGQAPGRPATATITPDQLARLLTVQQVGDTPGEADLRLLLDETALTGLVQDALAGVVQGPQDATVRLAGNGRPQIRPAVVGARLDDGAVLAGARQVLAVDGPVAADEGAPAPENPSRVAARTVFVQTIPVQPEITAEDAAQWDVDSVMAEFESVFPTGPDNAARTENIRVGLTFVNGSVVMPGEQFSLADTLAPITPDRGYVEAGVISDGRLVMGIGGGLSQVSTTLLNAAWFSGVELDAFTPHSYYISRYPEGREATISVGLIDNVWTNDTDSPIVISTVIEGDTIVMRFWGDRQYTVQTETSPRRDVTEPQTRTDDSPDCLPQGAVPGFTVTVTRALVRSGDVIRTEDYTTTYDPSPGVTCTGAR